MQNDSQLPPETPESEPEQLHAAAPAGQTSPPLTVNDAGVLSPADTTETFPQRLTWFAAILPFFLALNTITSNGAQDTAPYWIYILAAISGTGLLIYLFVRQTRFIKRVYPAKKVRPQLLAIIGSAVVVCAAAVLGDITGAAAFNDSVGTVGSLALGGTFALIISIVSLEVAAIGNAIYIHLKGGANWLRILGWICYVLCWGVTAVAAYVAYAIAYSLHDPSTE